MPIGKNIVGVSEVQKLFEEVYKAPNKVLTSAVKNAAKIVLDYAKSQLVGRDRGQPYGKHPHPPGNLRKNIRLKSEKRKKGKRVYRIGGNEKAWYAHFIDYGFTDRSGVFHPGNRFLRDAIDMNRDRIRTEILDKLGDEIDKLK